MLLVRHIGAGTYNRTRYYLHWTHRTVARNDSAQSTVANWRLGTVIVFIFTHRTATKTSCRLVRCRMPSRSQLRNTQRWWQTSARWLQRRAVAFNRCRLQRRQHNNNQPSHSSNNCRWQTANKSIGPDMELTQWKVGSSATSVPDYNCIHRSMRVNYPIELTRN